MPVLCSSWWCCSFCGDHSVCFYPQGGAHEGLQHLGPFGNIPNIVAELTGDNVPKDFSDDHGYPDPPNPCPLGKTGKNPEHKIRENVTANSFWSMNPIKKSWSTHFLCLRHLTTFTAADGCLENAPDTAEFSREFQKHQHLFDPEHDYPALAKWVSTKQDWNWLLFFFIIGRSNGGKNVPYKFPVALYCPNNSPHIFRLQ